MINTWVRCDEAMATCDEGGMRLQVLLDAEEDRQA